MVTSIKQYSIHIPANCGNLHAVYSGEPPRSMGLVALWRDMELCGSRSGISTVPDETLARGVPMFVYWNGLGGGGGDQAVDCICRNRRHRFSRFGWTGLHGRYSVLLLGKVEISPCHMASFCTGRKHPSFLCRVILRRTDSGLTNVLCHVVYATLGFTLITTMVTSSSGCLLPRNFFKSSIIIVMISLAVAE